MSTAFPEIYDAHHAAIHGYLRARVRDDALAEDLVAETFAKAFAAHDRFVDHGHGERAWLFAIASNVLRDELRAGTRRAALLARLPAEARACEPAPSDPAETDPVLAGALRELRREELEVLLLSAWAEMSHEEIAVALDIPVGTVRSRMHRARRHLRKALAAGAAAGLAILVAVALWPAGGSTGPEPASARAACAHPGPAGRCLAAVGAVAGLYALPGTGDVLYERGSYAPVSVWVDDRSTGPGNHVQLAAAHTPFSVSRRATEERWLAPDGRLRMAHGDGGRAVLDTPHDVAAWKAAGSPDLERLVPAGATERPLSTDIAPDAARDQLLGANGLSGVLPAGDDPLAGLPRDPAALSDRLHEMAVTDRGDGGGEALVQETVSGFIATLLDDPASPPDLRRALIAVLARIPAARTLGLLRTPDGDRVAAIALPAGHRPDGQDVIAFDPDTGALRGSATTGEDGAVRWLRTSADVRARVPALGDRP